MAREPKQITAVIHMPESDAATRHFEQKMCEFYISQVEKRLQPLPKEQKLAVIEKLIENYSKTAYLRPVDLHDSRPKKTM